MFKKNLKNTLDQYGISINEKQLEKFEAFKNLMLKVNEELNLTSITDTKEIVDKHFLDSLLLTKLPIFSKCNNIIDIGTGSGFPAIPLLIYYPELSFVLNESLNKKVLFLEKVSKELNINFKVLNMRAEEASKLKIYRQKFDFCIARAVANLNILVELCIPFVKVGGYFIAYKGLNFKKELEIIEKNKKAIALGAKLVDTQYFNLPSQNASRVLIVFKKIKDTPSYFPRTYGIIKKEDILYN